MKTSLLFILIFFSVFESYGQNLVDNWSFEDTIPCDINPDPYSPESAPPWVSISQSPDYNSQEYCGYNNISFGAQIPNTGQAYMGIAVYSTASPNFARETFGQQLADTLINNHKYCVSF